MSLSVMQPRLQLEKNVACFFLRHRQVFFVKELARMTRDFVARVERFAAEQKLPLITFDNKTQQRKEVTELAVNNPRDFGLGKALHNLAALRQVAFAANRRLLHVQQLSHDPTLGDDEFHTLTTPQVIQGQRVSGLRLRGLIARVPKTHRYQLTDAGLDDPQSSRTLLRRITREICGARFHRAEHVENMHHDRKTTVISGVRQKSS
jgi:hypothetical protein